MQTEDSDGSRLRYKVLVSAPRALATIDRYRLTLEAAHCMVIAAQTVERLTEAELLPIVGDVHGMVCGDDQITKRVIDAAPHLRVISKWGTGIDSIDVGYARSRGIVVCNTPNAFSEPVADTVLGYMLLHARQLDRMTSAMRGGLWTRVPLRSLGECTLGIVGLGHCGQAVARRANAFGMRILATTIDDVAPEILSNLGVALVPLETLLVESEFISLHADLRADNRHLIDRKALRSMRNDAFLINTARGALIDEIALADALKEGWIAGAALDVFACEPLPVDSPLRAMPNLQLAPHNANASVRAAEFVHENSIANLVRGLGGVDNR